MNPCRVVQGLGVRCPSWAVAHHRGLWRGDDDDLAAALAIRRI